MFVAQEGKSLMHMWGWQKDQLHLKLHLPERLSCFSVSANGLWASGGTAVGHVYLWEIASGLLLASFDAAYRRINVLKFTDCSRALITGSEDSGVSVWDLGSLVDNSLDSLVPTPYASLSDHTLAITDLVVGRGAFPECRVWTSSVDGTVKQWSLNPPTLLTTYNLPPIPSQTPTSIAVDPLERFFHVGTTAGEIYHVRMIKRNREMGGAREEVEAVGGGGLGSEGVKIAEGKGRISLGTDITCLCLSTAGTHLITGTSTGEIHIHSLPSHQHTRSILSHVGSPISHVSTMLRPPDLVGHVSLTAAMRGGHGAKDGWPMMEVRPFERMRVGQKQRMEHEVGVMLGQVDDDALSGLDVAEEEVSTGAWVAQTSAVPAVDNSSERLLSLEAEVVLLRSQLSRAKQINDQIWSGVVDHAFEKKRATEDVKE